MTIKARILLLGLLAIGSLLYILGAQFAADSREYAGKHALFARMEAAEKLSGLVHELQKERGISAGYLVIRSKNNEDAIDAQRAATDRAKALLDSDTAQHLENLAKLAEVREMVSGHRTMPLDSFGYYTLSIVEILDRINALALDSDTPALKGKLSAHAHLLYAKEYLGEIRGSLNESFSQGSVDRERVATVGRLLGMHQYHSKIFLRDTTPAAADAFRATLAQPGVQAVFGIIQSVLSERGGVVTSEEWMAAASYAIDQLREVENQSAAHLRQQIKSEIAAAKQRFLLNGIVTLGVLLTLVFLAGSAIFHLLHALNMLLANIAHTVNTRDFSNRIRPRSSDGIGAISRNFNELLAVAERLIKEKDYLASTDSLTGAYNRRKFTELFASELQRKLRYSGRLALIMFDIDHFKHVNDEFGHAAGDAVLREMARLVHDLIRANDVLVRWGGEEFLIFLPQNGYEAAAALAEKLRCTIEDYRFPGVPKVTVSFGVSEYVAGDTLESLCARADNALYRAKQEGRNRVCVGLADADPMAMEAAGGPTRLP
ncbi:MAG: diguanylate cyclase [Gallionella sp.]|nr:MAG: diguanylate cyclase [Gallionella sp.]